MILALKNKKLIFLYILVIVILITLITRIIISKDWINISILTVLIITCALLGFIEEKIENKQHIKSLTEDEVLYRQFVWFNPKSKKIQLDRPRKWSQNETLSDE